MTITHNPKNRVPAVASAAAERMAAMGGSPRVQLTAAKVASGQKNLTYKPHQGKRERERRSQLTEPHHVE